MAHPLAPKPNDPVKPIGRIFGAPLIVNGWTWLPFNEIIAWGVFTWLSARKNPARPFGQQAGLGLLKAVVFLGSEWLHNLAHAAAASWVGRPADALLIYMGMPLLIYDAPEDPAVTPRQHLLRSAAGPGINTLLLGLAGLLRAFTRPGSGAREVADTAVGMNAFLATASYTPNPSFDGGPLLKWSLVSCGRSPAQADAIVRQANRAVGMGLAGGAAALLGRRSWLLGVTLAFLSAACLAHGFSRPDKSAS